MWESAHFRYHTRSDDDGACEAVLVQLERHFEAVRGYLGFPWPEGRKVDYYKYSDQPDYAHNADCPAETVSCAVGSTIMSPFALQEHELIHAYLAPLGAPPSFFVEGIAVALACHEPFATLGIKPAWPDVVASPPSDHAGVYRAGPWFAGYLLFRYGPERFMALYDRLDDRSAGPEAIASSFALAYGETLDAVWTAATASGDRVRCVNPWQCGGANLVLDGSPQTLGKACDGSDNTRTFQLDVEADVVMSYHDTAYYVPVSCDPVPFLAVSGDSRGVAANATIARIAPGSYVIRGERLDASGTIGLRSLPEQVYARDCAQLEPVDLGTRDLTAKWDLDLTIPNDGASWFIKLTIPSDRKFWWPRAATVEVEACLTCAETQDCQAFRGEPPLDAEGNVMLRLTPANPGPGYATYEFGYKLR